MVVGVVLVGCGYWLLVCGAGGVMGVCCGVVLGGKAVDVLFSPS